jgi:hypothetical protein
MGCLFANIRLACLCQPQSDDGIQDHLIVRGSLHHHTNVDWSRAQWNGHGEHRDSVGACPLTPLHRATVGNRWTCEHHQAQYRSDKLFQGTIPRICIG